MTTLPPDTRNLYEVTVALVAPAFVCFPLWIAERHGMFAARGLSCRIDVIGTTDGVTSALERGGAQVAISAAEGFGLAAALGSSIRMIAGNANQAPLRLVAQTDITSVAQLRGKRIGTSSLREGTATILKTMLAAHGLDFPADYELTLAGAHPQRWKALQRQEIDACLQLLPFDYMAEDAGYSVLDAAVDHVPSYAFSAIAVDVRWAEENHTHVVNLLAGLEEATRWAETNREEAAQILAAATHTDLGHARRGLDHMIDEDVVPADLRISRRGLDAVFSTMVAAGTVDGDAGLDYGRCVDDRYRLEVAAQAGNG